jgi:hypothetical protein
MTQDLSRGSRACRHASPRCVPLHHVVRWLIGHTPSLSKEPTKWQKVANDTSNPLTLPLALRRGRHKPLTITGGGQEQSPTLANASKLLQAVLVVTTTKKNKTRLPVEVAHPLYH